MLATLATDQPVIKLLTASRDGLVLVAGFNNDNSLGSLAASFAIWEADKNQPARRFVEPGLTGVGVSPDGRRIALSVFGQKRLAVYDWQTDQRQEIPLRTPYGSSHAYAMYWTADGKYLAAYVDTYPASIIVYETSSWKPLAQWNCGRIGDGASFAFTKDGVLHQLRGGEINKLDVTKL